MQIARRANACHLVRRASDEERGPGRPRLDASPLARAVSQRPTCEPEQRQGPVPPSLKLWRTAVALAKAVEPENAGELAQALEEAEASMTGTRRRAGGQMRPTGPTWALKVGAMTATRRLASGQMLGNREIGQ